MGLSLKIRLPPPAPLLYSVETDIDIIEGVFYSFAAGGSDLNFDYNLSAGL